MRLTWYMLAAAAVMVFVGCAAVVGGESAGCKLSRAKSRTCYFRVGGCETQAVVLLFFLAEP